MENLFVILKYCIRKVRSRIEKVDVTGENSRGPTFSTGYVSRIIAIHG